MILAQLNLPTTTNSGKSTRRQLNQLEVETCNKFGGCTTFNGMGKWVDKNKLYFDKLRIYQVAIELKDKKEFITMCKKYGKLTKQLAIYVVINNKPRIINL
tara:strand:- start:2782 stop:3084 length:303 start_codon:yes stop_codon:yes gene_type:complete